MRLYLASSRLDDNFPELLTMTGCGGRAAVISNAVDFIPDDERRAYERTVFDPVCHFRDQGYDAFDLDLRQSFGKPQELAERLRDVGLVWVVGGNAFLLRRAMRQSGFDRLIGDLLAEDRLVYGGWSAGAVVAGPDLRGIELMDDPQVVTPGYEPEICWSGLGLIQTRIVPHYKSDHPEAPDADRLVTRMLLEGTPHLALRDGETLIVNGEQVGVRPAISS
jgi:dipeptidase E